MSKINVSKDYGIVIRKIALEERGIPISKVFDIMETVEPLGENNKLLSFGPHFGGEAADEFSKRLNSLGLSYIDDYFIFCGDFPDWANFYVCTD